MALIKVCDVCGKQIPTDCAQYFEGIDSCGDCDAKVIQPISNSIRAVILKEYQNISDGQMILAHYIKSIDWDKPIYRSVFGTLVDEFKATKEMLLKK